MTIAWLESNKVQMNSTFISIKLLDDKAPRYLGSTPEGSRFFFEFRAFRPVHCRPPADTLISPSSSLPRSDPAAPVGRSSAQGPTKFIRK